MKFLKKRPQVEVEELDITSLLDVLVILLVFLLQNMANSELSLDLVRELTLPFSESRGISEQGVVLQVNAAREVYLNNVVIGVVDLGQDYSQDIINKLEEETKRQEKLMKQKEAGQGLLVNLVLDKSLSYEVIDKLLKSVAQAGYTQFKFIVQGVE